MDDDRKTRMTLIQRIKNTQDEAAWKEFFSIYQNYVYVVVRNLNIGHHDAEEIVQKVFTKVLDKIPQFNYLPHKGKFRHWLCAITRNMVIDLQRARNTEKKSMEKFSEGSSVSSHEEITIPDIEVIAEKEWRNYLANLALEHARKELSPLEIKCFISHTREKTPREIATELSIAENTVYIYCRRVKDFIKKKINELENQFE